MRLAENAFDIARDDIDIVEFVQDHIDVEVERRGSEYAISCPKGGDSTPSFVLYAKNNKFKCYHCDWYGSVIDLAAYINNLDPKEAVEWLHEEYPDKGIMVEGKESSVGEAKAKYVKAKTQQSDFAHKALMKDEKLLAAIVAKRGISLSTMKKFKVGLVTWGEFPRLHLPQFLGDGKKVIASVTRGLAKQDERPKYLARNVHVDKEGKTVDEGTAGSFTIWRKGEYLYGLEKCDKTKPVYVVEGHLDVLAAYELGMQNFVALGTNTITPAQAELLVQFPSIILVPDNDKGGSSTVSTNLLYIRTAKPGIPVFIFKSWSAFDQDLKDVGDILVLVSKSERHSSESVRTAFLGMPTFIENFLFDKISQKHLVGSLDSDIGFLPDLNKLMAVATEPIARSILFRRIGERYNVDPQIVVQMYAERSKQQ